MKKRLFTIVLLCGIFSLVFLATVETLWSVSSYRAMRNNYKHQLQSILEEASWQYVVIDKYMEFGSVGRLHTLVGDQLTAAGISTEYVVEVLSATDAEPIVLMAKGDKRVIDRPMSVDKSLSPIVLRLTVNDPHNDILSSMRNILLLQLLSILLLVAIFYYLVNTLFRAKTVEKIRQDLTHNITHELRTPIAAAYATTDLLLTSEQISEQKSLRDEYLGMTLKELKWLNNMVDEILRSSTDVGLALNLERCNLRSIVEDVRTTLSLKFQDAEIEWVIDVDEEIVIYADRFHLESSISALVDNGIKYNESRPKIAISARVSKNHTTIVVSDNGVGIPYAEQRHIFEKFYRIPQGNRHDTKGYGLGLSYVKSVAKSHNGTIALSSKVGVGTSFYLTLPNYVTKKSTNS